MTRKLLFNAAILEATTQLMEKYPEVFVMGLGAPDPKGLFQTTLGLQEKFGDKRVMDMPVSENGMTGILIGASLMGLRPIMTHQRVDFTLLSLDQLINNAAKWYYMFDGQKSVPIVFRIFIGRGWGQGPQHSQTLHNLFSHIPGLKVVAPSTCYDAKGLLISSVEDNNPVIFLEHRWLHTIHGDVPENYYRIPLSKAHILQEGNDITLIASSHMTFEAWKALEMLKKYPFSIELLDLRTLYPFDKEALLASVRKTGRVLILDADWKTCGYAAEIMATIVENAFNDLKCSPERLTFPDHPCPTSWALANYYYPTPHSITAKVLKIMGYEKEAEAVLNDLRKLQTNIPLDTPDKHFTGPF